MKYLVLLMAMVFACTPPVGPLLTFCAGGQGMDGSIGLVCGRRADVESFIEAENRKMEEMRQKALQEAYQDLNQ